MNKYIVLTGIVTFEVSAFSPREAIDWLKTRFQEASHEQFFHAERWGFGYSMVEAHLDGRLNYLVLNEDRDEILVGELDGQFQELPGREFFELFDYNLSENLKVRHKQKLHAAGL